MPKENISAFEITDFEGFYKSLADEAFNESALLIGKRFFRRTKSDLNIFKKQVLDRRQEILPVDEFIMNEVNKCVFTDADRKTLYILPADMEYVITILSNKITYNILSHLNDNGIVEMCYSSEKKDIIWRIRK